MNFCYREIKRIERCQSWDLKLAKSASIPESQITVLPRIRRLQSIMVTNTRKKL